MMNQPVYGTSTDFHQSSTIDPLLLDLNQDINTDISFGDLLQDGELERLFDTGVWTTTMQNQVQILDLKNGADHEARAIALDHFDTFRLALEAALHASEAANLLGASCCPQLIEQIARHLAANKALIPILAGPSGGKIPNLLSSFTREHSRSHNTEIQTDTDGSWNEHDAMEVFYATMKSQIKALDASEKNALVTPALASAQRRVIHSMAHLKHYSHLSVGPHGVRRVIISKTAIRSHASLYQRQKCWNGKFTQMVLDPCALLLSIDHYVTEEMMSGFIAFKTLSPPSSIRAEYEPQRSRTLLYLRYEDASVAVDALECLYGRHAFPAHWPETMITIDFAIYERWRATDYNPLTESLVQMSVQMKAFGTLKEQVGSSVPQSYSPPFAANSGARKQPNVPYYPSEPLASDRDEMYASAGGGESGYGSSCSKRSYTIFRSDDIAEAGYGMGAIHADEGVKHKRRRRLPMLKKGYVCREEGCDKTFDHNGTRAKHEKIHWSPETYQHECTHCSKRFIYAKDLRRHESTHLRTWLGVGRK